MQKITSQNNEIQTSELSIAGNVMSWKSTVIQLSNVSILETVSLEPIEFPGWLLVTFCAGALLFLVNVILAFCVLCVAAGIVYILYKENEKLARQKKLRIHMNSGKVFTIIFSDLDFLNQVYAVLSTIIAEDNYNKHIKIDINNCTISGSARVLNDIIL